MNSPVSWAVITIVDGVCIEYKSHQHQQGGSLISLAQVARGALVLHWEATQIAPRVRDYVDCCGPSECVWARGSRLIPSKYENIPGVDPAQPIGKCLLASLPVFSLTGEDSKPSKPDRQGSLQLAEGRKKVVDCTIVLI